jgi:hypothetical protein
LIVQFFRVDGLGDVGVNEGGEDDLAAANYVKEWCCPNPPDVECVRKVT